MWSVSGRLREVVFFAAVRSLQKPTNPVSQTLLAERAPPPSAPANAGANDMASGDMPSRGSISCGGASGASGLAVVVMLGLRQAAESVRAAVVTVLCLSIRVYQCVLSPLLGNCCRFEPSCSRYAQLCIERLGPVRGSWLSLRRLVRCHPFCPGGHDPPPEVTS